MRSLLRGVVRVPSWRVRTRSGVVSVLAAGFAVTAAAGFAVAARFVVAAGFAVTAAAG
jgi:hypothetical protein